MGLLDSLAGGGGAAPQFTDFISRYQQGAPHEGLDDQETLDRYNDVAGEVDPDTYESAAQESFSRMDPDSRGQCYGTGYDGRSNDPESLARMTRQVHSQSPGLLGSLLGGGGGGGGGGLGALAGNPAAKAALGGIAAMVAQRAMGR